MKLTEHFTLEEFTTSQQASRLGIDNTPDADVIDNLRTLANYLEGLRAWVARPIIISSGYRSPSLNKAIGGAVESAHMSGYAADIITPQLPALTVCRSVVNFDHPFDQVIHEYGAWCHVSIDPRSRRQQLTICKGSGYIPGLVGCSG
jgi:zinc D-Ala-D-Ala carboxypeptidase